jgi:hypothetical protein
MKFAITTRRGDITGDVVNPGGWFGKAWLIGYPLGNFGFYLIVEADSEQDAIDELADSDKYGHAINLDEKDVDPNDENVARAGNDSHPVDLDNVTIQKATGAKYLHPDLPGGGLSPAAFQKFIDDLPSVAALNHFVES